MRTAFRKIFPLKKDYFPPEAVITKCALCYQHKFEKCKYGFTFVNLSEIQGRSSTGSELFYTTHYVFAWYLAVLSPTLKIQNFDAAAVLGEHFHFLNPKSSLQSLTI